MDPGSLTPQPTFVLHRLWAEALRHKAHQSSIDSNAASFGLLAVGCAGALATGLSMQNMFSAQRVATGQWLGATEAKMNASIGFIGGCSLIALGLALYSKRERQTSDVRERLVKAVHDIPKEFDVDMPENTPVTTDFPPFQDTQEAVLKDFGHVRTLLNSGTVGFKPHVMRKKLLDLMNENETTFRSMNKENWATVATMLASMLATGLVAVLAGYNVYHRQLEAADTLAGGIFIAFVVVIGLVLIYVEGALIAGIWRKCRAWDLYAVVLGQKTIFDILKDLVEPPPDAETQPVTAEVDEALRALRDGPQQQPPEAVP